MPMQQKTTNADTAVTRTDVLRLLQEVGCPEQLDVSGQDVRGISLMNCNLRGANLSQARVCEANLCGAKLSKADLHGADLRGTYLCWADLRGANLSEADLREADLSWADLQEADLRGVHLERATLYGASLGRERKDRGDRRRAFLRERRQIRPGICAQPSLHERGWLRDGSRHTVHMHTYATEKIRW